MWSFCFTHYCYYNAVVICCSNYRISSKERPGGAHLKVSPRREAVIRGESSVEGGAHLRIFTLGEALIRVGRYFEEIRYT